MTEDAALGSKLELLHTNASDFFFLCDNLTPDEVTHTRSAFIKKKKTVFPRVCLSLGWEYFWFNDCKWQKRQICTENLLSERVPSVHYVWDMSVCF